MKNNARSPIIYLFLRKPAYKIMLKPKYYKYEYFLSERLQYHEKIAMNS